MTRKRGPFDSRLDRLEQNTDIPDLGEQDIYAMPERESAVALAPGNRVYRVFQTFTDVDGTSFYGIRTGEGAIEKAPKVESKRRSVLRGGKHSASGRT